MENLPSQSINLALSIRGREALRAVGLEDDLIKQHAVCMRGRMIHHKNGNIKEILYDSVKGNVSFLSSFAIFQTFYLSSPFVFCAFVDLSFLYRYFHSLI